MLVLTRTKGKGVVIRDALGHECRVQIVEIRGNKVRLGFTGAVAEFTFARDKADDGRLVGQEVVHA